MPARSKTSLPLPRSGLTRRKLLRASLGLGALAALGTTLRHLGHYPPLSRSYRQLTPQMVAVLEAVAEVLWGEQGPLPSATDAAFLDYYDEMLDSLGVFQRTQLRAMITVFEHGTTPLSLRAGRFTRLSLDAREGYLRSWETSSIYTRRMVSEAMIVTTGMAYYSSPVVQAAMGMQPRCPSGRDARVDPRSRP